MSIESAEAFYQRIRTDEAFRTQIESYPLEEHATILQAASHFALKQNGKLLRLRF